MKIAVNTRFYQQKNTGIHNYTKSLYTSLQKIDVANEYVFLQTQTNKILGPTKIINLPNNPVGELLFDNLLINKLLSDEKPQILHAPCYVLPIIKLPKIKYVVTIHDLSFKVYPEFMETKLRYYYDLAVGHSAKIADVILADSENTKNDIMKYFKVSESKIYILYPSLESEYISQNKYFTNGINFPYILTTTTHSRRKNIFNTIRAFGSSKHSNETKLIICGLITNKHNEELKKLISSLGLNNKVVIKGYVTTQQLLELYDNAELYIYSSFYEGFGLPVIESMSRGCLVISSNTSSLPEINTNKVFTFDPTNVSEITERIDYSIELSEIEKKRISLKNKKFALEFNPDRMAREMLKIYDRCKNN